MRARGMHKAEERMGLVYLFTAGHLRHGGVLLEVRGQVDGTLARGLEEFARQPRLGLLVEIQTRLGEVAEHLAVSLVALLLRVHVLVPTLARASHEHQPAEHRVVVEVVHNI